VADYGQWSGRPRAVGRGWEGRGVGVHVGSRLVLPELVLSFSVLHGLVPVALIPIPPLIRIWPASVPLVLVP
jgi:hypothetical protein